LQAWRAAGERVERIAGQCIYKGRMERAARYWLRAAMYYQLAERQLAVKTPEAQMVYERSLDAFGHGLRLTHPHVEKVEIAYDGAYLPALFVPAADVSSAPCIVHFDGLDVSKEIIFMLHRRELAHRRVSMLICDHPGIGEALRLRQLHLTADTENAAAACLDYLTVRGDVPLDRTGIMALSAGGYYAARAAAFEPRLRFCAIWGAIWDYEQTWAERFRALDHDETPPTSVPWQIPVWVLGADSRPDALHRLSGFKLEGVADRITCPVLVLHGENDRQIPVEVAERVHRSLRSAARADLVVIPRGAPGAEHCQLDAVDVAVEILHDWVEQVA
jgi:pimeloyl-ACP methyl ester carboxylesterase